MEPSWECEASTTSSKQSSLSALKQLVSWMCSTCQANQGCSSQMRYLWSTVCWGMIKWKGASRACQTVVESPRGWWRHPDHPLSAQVSILNHPSRSSIPVQDDGPRLQRVDHCLRGDRSHLRSHRQELEARPPLQVRNKIIYVLLFCCSYDIQKLRISFEGFSSPLYASESPIFHTFCI